MIPREARPIAWLGSTLTDVRSYSESVRQQVGTALREAQQGGKHQRAKPLKGFGNASVLEIVADDADGTYRVVYTVKFRDRLFVLHAFTKKSTHGSATPDHEIAIVRARLTLAAEIVRTTNDTGGQT